MIEGVDHIWMGDVMRDPAETILRDPLIQATDALVRAAGPELASALLANGVRLVGRSFKYHRPRGILSAGPEEPNALVELRSGARREPNTRATVTELFEGLEASSQNRWPSLAFDLLSVNSLLGPALQAGFYYKTFMWPASFWEKLTLAARVIVAIENPADVCVISARPFGTRSIFKYAQYTGAQYLPNRYTPGTFTNQITKKFMEPRLVIVTDPSTDHQVQRCPPCTASLLNLSLVL